MQAQRRQWPVATFDLVDHRFRTGPELGSDFVVLVVASLAAWRCSWIFFFLFFLLLLYFVLCLLRVAMLVPSGTRRLSVKWLKPYARSRSGLAQPESLDSGPSVLTERELRSRFYFLVPRPHTHTHART